MVRGEFEAEDTAIRSEFATADNTVRAEFAAADNVVRGEFAAQDTLIRDQISDIRENIQELVLQDEVNVRVYDVDVGEWGENSGKASKPLLALDPATWQLISKQRMRRPDLVLDCSLSQVRTA